MKYMSYHMIGFLLGVLLDRIVGDPPEFPHPIRAIGALISRLDRMLLEPVLQTGRNRKKERIRGVILCAAVLFATGAVTAAVLFAARMIHPIAGLAAETILTCYILAAKSLKTESMHVYRSLKEGTLEQARYAVSRIVGRDTQVLSREGVIKAAVETVAENTSDGVIAPAVYTFLGGPVLGMLYKAVNTMDSMVGYHNERYESFGTAAARLDDAVNYLPARLSALLMILAAFLSGKEYSGKNGWKIFLRDRYQHKSPNSAQTESVCAGVLGIRLAGDAMYFGKLVKKPTIGDDLRSPEPEDIPRTCKLMYRTELLTVLLCILVHFLLLR